MGKSLVIIAIISLGLAGAILIVQQSDILNLSNSKTSALNSQNLDANISKSLSVDTPRSNNIQSEEIVNQQNLTEIAINDLANALVNRNPAGPSTIEGQNWLNAIDPKQVTEDLIAKAAENFSLEDLRLTVNDSSLKITNDNSKESIEKYLLNFRNIIKEIASNISFSNSITENDTEKIAEGFANIVSAYNQGITKFLELQVPSDMVALHKKEIELLGTNLNIYKKIQNYQQDPVVAILSAKEIENVDKEFTTLKNQIINFVKKYGVII